MLEKIKQSVIETIPYLIVIALIILIRIYIITPVRVDGISMESTLKAGDILLLNKYDHKFERFDIVVFNYNDEKLIKRVIGLPGETIEFKDNKLYVNGKIIEESLSSNSLASDFKLEDLGYTTIPEGEYFLVGDNRKDSYDSRYFGTIKKEEIIGTVKIRLFPFTRIGKV